MLSRTYSRGLGVHAASKLRYRVPEGAVRFQAIIGLIDAVHGNWQASVEFHVLDQDGRVLLDAGYFNNRRYPEAIQVDLDGATEIILEVSNAGDGWWADQAAWVEAAFLMP
jgi:hypothetical protein